MTPLAYFKIALCVAVLAIVGYGGWHFGSQNVQVKWDAANVLANQEAEKTRAANQKDADAIEKLVEDEITKRDQVITNLNMELSNEKNKFGSCGKQPLPYSSVQLYNRAAASD